MQHPVNFTLKNIYNIENTAKKNKVNNKKYVYAITKQDELILHFKIYVTFIQIIFTKLIYKH